MRRPLGWRPSGGREASQQPCDVLKPRRVSRSATAAAPTQLLHPVANVIVDVLVDRGEVNGLCAHHPNLPVNATPAELRKSYAPHDSSRKLSTRTGPT